MQLKYATHLHQVGRSDKQECWYQGTSDRSVVGTHSWDKWSPDRFLRGTGMGHYPPAEHSGNTANSAPHVRGATLVTDTSCRGRFSKEDPCEKRKTM